MLNSIQHLRFRIKYGMTKDLFNLSIFFFFSGFHLHQFVCRILGIGWWFDYCSYLSYIKFLISKYKDFK